MQELLNRIDDRGLRDEVVGQEQSMMESDTSGASDLETRVNEHLGSLPEPAKRAIAAHLTPEFAKLVGLITGSEPLAEVLGKMANPDIALVPMPREKAKEIADQVASQQPQPQAAPAAPVPAGAMGGM